MQNGMKNIYKIDVVCLLILALLSLFEPFSRDANTWYKIIALAAIVVISLPLAKRGEDEKKVSIMKITGYLVLLCATFSFIYILSAEPDAEHMQNDLAAAIEKLDANAIFLWAAGLGLYLVFVASEAFKKGRKGTLLLVCGSVAAIAEFLFGYLPAFTQTRSLALQLTGAVYLLLALGFWRLSMLEGYGHL